MANLHYIHTHTHTHTHTHNNSLKKSNEMQQYEDTYLPINYSTCFGRPSRPLSGVHKTVVAASGTDHTVKCKVEPEAKY